MASGAVTVPPSLREAVCTLNDGNRIPLIGLGVYVTKPGGETYDAVRSALKCGYRHIDTAMIYGNEKDVGRAVRDSGIPREQIFITTKLFVKNFQVWEEDLPPPTASPATSTTTPTTTATTATTTATSTGLTTENKTGCLKEKNAAYEFVMEQAKESMTNLGTYIDLYLMHSPHHPAHRLHMWRALEDLKTSQRVKSIGVSNYGILHLQELFKNSRVRPAVNQIEIHPFLQRTELANFCNTQGILVEAYSPLAKAKKMKARVLVALSEKHQKSPAQILIRWSLQKGFIVLPKSSRDARIRENMQVFDFVLTSDDVALLDQLEEHLVTGWDPTILE